ncbi:MAG: hypothetical protein WAP03_25770 [Methylorubrum rhodinum]|uniref:hypothetical protein n=1 Tax=Methylorubrum rhodinum TaxID=29428 RepID=UPI003BAFC566
MLMAVLMLPDQVSGDPSGVSDQSFARIRAPSSPPPLRKASGVSEGNADALGVIALPSAAQGSHAILARRPEVVQGLFLQSDLRQRIG